MPLNKFNPFKNLNILLLKLTLITQVLAKIPSTEKDIRKCRNILKDVLLNNENLLNSRPLGSFLDESNKILKEKSTQFLAENLKSSNPKKILVVSHDFSLTGAPKATLMLAKTLKEIYNYTPIVLSITPGAIENEFKEANIPFYYYNQLPVKRTDFLSFFDNFDLIIANSLLFDFLNEIEAIKTPIIWWSHEIFNRKKDLKKIKEFMPHLYSFWSGSPLTRKILEKNNPNKKNSLMLYGLPELSLPKINNKETDKIVFSLMGTWDKRKRQDLLLDAIKKLPQQIREKAIFYIIGEKSPKKYIAKLLKEFEKYSEVKILPQMSFEELLNYYAESDVILSTSDFDPMPIVVTYGLMFKKLCLCSDAIGTALLIKDKENGILFKAGNAKDLNQKITDIVQNFDKYKPIAEKGYEVYKNNFSQELFKNNLEKLVDEAIKFKIEKEEKENKIENNFKISIITASYNYAHFIEKTINSVLAQTYDNWELIIVDDGSKDNSIDIINKYLSNPKIKLYQHKNGKNRGLNETIKLGLKQTQGSYIAFLESDDYWDENYLFEKVKLVDRNPDAKIISNDINLFGDNFATIKKQEYVDYCKNTLLSENLNLEKEIKKSNLCPTFSCVMIKKDILEKLNFDTAIPGWLDWWLWRQAIVYSKIYFVNKKLTNWQIHSQSYNQGIDFASSAKILNKKLKPVIRKAKFEKFFNILH